MSKAEMAKRHPKAVPRQPEEIIAARRELISQKSTVIGFIVKLIVVVAAIWLVFTQVYGLAAMQGESMFPRIRDGDIMLFYRLERKRNIGDVLTFTSSDGTRYTGRIVAMGGDTVDMSEAGELIVNGNVQQEDTVYPTYKAEAQIEFPYTVEENGLFLLSDLRTGGTDSRIYGAVQDAEIDGKVITILRRRGI